MAGVVGGGGKEGNKVSCLSFLWGLEDFCLLACLVGWFWGESAVC